MQFAGTGERAIPTASSGESGRPGPTSEQGDYEGGEGDPADGAEPGEGGGEGEGGEPADAGPSGAASAAAQVMSGLAAAGAALFKLAAALIALMGLLVLFRSLPHLGAWSAALAAWFRGLVPEKPAPEVKGPTSSPFGRPDPLKGLDAVARLPPVEAIAAVYDRLTLLAEARGCERPERWTALEFAGRLPHELQPAAREIRALTDLYVASAYRPGGAGEAERASAVEALREAAAVTDR